MIARVRALIFGVRERWEAATRADLRAASESQAVRALLDAEVNRLEAEVMRLEEAAFDLSVRVRRARTSAVREIESRIEDACNEVMAGGHFLHHTDQMVVEKYWLKVAQPLARCSWNEDLLNNAAEVLFMKQPDKWTTPERAFMRAHATREKLTEYANEDPARCGERCEHGGDCSSPEGHATPHASKDARGGVLCSWAR